MNTTTTLPPILGALAAKNRPDYGMRIGQGTQSLSIRADARFLDMFPDGCKVTAAKVNDHYEITLLNRASGGSWRSRTDSGVTYAESSFSKGTVGGTVLPQFGAVAPAKVQAVPGGVKVTLPADLPPKQDRASRGSKPARVPRVSKPVADTPRIAPAPAPATTPQVTAPSATPAAWPKAAIPAASLQAAPTVQRPTIDLYDAVQAVNAWKRLQGVGVLLQVKEDGTLVALAEYS